MPGLVRFQVFGLQAIERALHELGPQVAGRIARSALNRSATPVVRRARELAPQPDSADDPYATGELKKAITKRLRRARSGSDRQEILVGVERPRSRILHLLEFGAAHMPAEPFMRPSLDENKGEVIGIQQQVFRERIEKEAIRLAQKHKAKAR